MLAQNDIKNWLSLFESDEQVFTSHDLKPTIDFLRNAREPAKGWGDYSRVTTSLHQTALVIQALFNSNDSSVLGIASGAASYTLVEFKDGVEHLQLEELCDLLTIINSEKKPADDIYIAMLVSAIKTNINGKINQGFLPIKDLSYGIVSILDSKLDGVDEIIDDWVLFLTRQQNGNGSFPPATGQTVSFVATAWAIKVFTRLKNKQFDEPLRKAVEFLKNEIRQNEWGCIGSGIYEQSMILWALSEMELVDYSMLQAGIDNVLFRKNSDGSWGAEKGQIGNIGFTALSLLALTAAGKNCYVPARLARAAVKEMQVQLSNARAERDQLEKDFDRRAQDDCGQVVAERNKLLQINKKQKNEIDEFNDQIKKLNYEINYLEKKRFYTMREGEVSIPKVHENIFIRLYNKIIRWDGFMLMGIMSITMLLLISETGLVEYRGFKNTKLFIVIILSLLVLNNADTLYSLLKSVFIKKKDNPVSSLKISLKLRNLRYDFIDVIGALPVSIRDEFVYFLFKNLIDAPPDIGMRYIEDFIIKYELPSIYRSKIINWTKEILKLDSRERRLLFETLRD